ncbi:MAG: ABC transporter substrate-binding protein [Dehalococcoidia bacterium]|nr:ABC transporter substrate-binding protein [Dehalococcoidia bacterium]
MPSLSGSVGIYHSSGSAHNYIDGAYDPVIGTDANRKDDPTRGFAMSWQVSADGKVWTFKTRDDVFFHNGVKATASDVGWWVLAIRDNKDVTVSAKGPFARDVVDAKAPDANTLVLTLANANYFWPFTYFAMGGCGGSPCMLNSQKHFEAVGIGGYNKNPVSSGPFKITDIQVASKVTMEAIDKHWFWGVPRVKTLVFQEIPEDGTLTAALRTNQIQIGAVSRSSASIVKGDSNLRLISRAGGTINYRMEQSWVTEYPGYGKNPLADVNVRRAMNFQAIDRTVLATNFMKGYAIPSVNYPANQGDPSYEKIPVPAFDVAKAKQMLAAAGYPNGFAIDMHIWTPPTQPELPEIFEAMAGMWENIGIKVTRRPISQASYSQVYLIPKKFDRPSVSGMYSLGLYRFSANQGASAFEEAGQFQTSRDKVMEQRVADWNASKTLEAYNAAGKGVMKDYVDQVISTPAVLDYTALWGARADPSVIPSWFEVTKDNIAWGLFRAGLNEKKGF